MSVVKPLEFFGSSQFDERLASRDTPALSPLRISQNDDVHRFDFAVGNEPNQINLRFSKSFVSKGGGSNRGEETDSLR